MGGASGHGSGDPPGAPCLVHATMGLGLPCQVRRPRSRNLQVLETTLGLCAVCVSALQKLRDTKVGPQLQGLFKCHQGFSYEDKMSYGSFPFPSGSRRGRWTQRGDLRALANRQQDLEMPQIPHPTNISRAFPSAPGTVLGIETRRDALTASHPAHSHQMCRAPWEVFGRGRGGN